MTTEAGGRHALSSLLIELSEALGAVYPYRSSLSRLFTLRSAPHKVETRRGNELVAIPSPGVARGAELQERAVANSATAAAVNAMESCRRVVDVLRILRDDDLGIVHAHIAGEHWGAPYLPPDAVWEFQESAAPFSPRRGAYGGPAGPLPPSSSPDVRDLLSRHMSGIPTPGFEVAIQRFRDACERYWPGQPESLLDCAIALGALFLGDQDNKELRHRLSLRAARLLSKDVPTRKQIARAVKALYDVRSKVAHGATLGSKRADVRKLRQCVAMTPTILRLALHRFLLGDGPGALKDAALSDWWSDVELS